MAHYNEFKARSRQKRNVRIAICIALSVLILALIAGLVYVTSRMVEGKPLFESIQINPIIQVDTSNSAGSTAQGETVPETVNRPWNNIIPLNKTINFEMTNVDARMLALPKNGRVSTEYFRTTMFIGDSITQGLALYPDSGKTLAGIATVCAYKGTGPKQILENNVGKLPDGTEVPMWDDISAKAPMNIYIMIGTNAMVGQPDEALLKYYGDLLDALRVQFPNIPVYVQSIMPVTAKTAEKRPNLSNERIRLLNNAICQLAAQRGMYYINLHEVFENEQGALKEEYAYSDGIHLTPDGYALWLDYLSTHTAYSPFGLGYLTEPYSA